MHALTIDNISFSYDGNVPTLSDVSFGLERGEFLGLLGPNGCGKTTLLRLLDRISIPRKGTISLTGRSLNSYTRTEIARHIAFVPQEAGILFPFTVLEIVLMGRSPHSRGAAFESSRDRDVAEEAMRLTDVAHLARQPITALSGGERQRVFIARALAQQPEIILLDEPNAHLDIAHQIDIFHILRTLNRQSGLTVLSVTHDLNLAAAYSDRVALMVCGSIVALGAPAEVLTGDRIREVFRTEAVVDMHPTSHTIRISPAYHTPSRHHNSHHASTL
jgi:iron complex transport system ATP-binding protein